MSISEWLSENLSSKQIVDDKSFIYHQTKENTIQNKIKNHQYKIIWFNPSFSKSFKIIIGEEFFKLINLKLKCPIPSTKFQ